MSDARKPGWFRGSATNLSKRMHALLFLLLMVISICLCYSQFGIMAWGNDLEGDLNFVLFLIPVALCITMLGAIPGVGLAFLTGLFIMYRAQWTPTTIYDYQLADPFMSTVSITIGAMLMAAIVIPSSRHWPTDLSRDVNPLNRVPIPRIVFLIIGCFVFAFVFSYGTRGLVYLFVTPGGEEYGYAAMVAEYLSSLTGPFVFLEGVLNGIILSISCVATVISDANRQSGSWKGGLSHVFNRWLLLAMFMVFLLASSVSFCVETMRATEDAENQIEYELEYLQYQVENRLAQNESVNSVADGYKTALGGTIFIVRNGMIVSSNDPECVGKSAAAIISSANANNYDFLINQATQRMLTGYDEVNKEFSGICALIGNYFTIIETAPLSAMYKARTTTLMYNAGFFFLLLTVVFLLTRLLLKRIVVAPVHDTNKTLERITTGELSRRVEERNVKEFDELSKGINTTVAALRETIGEVEQRNKQDLLAAKAIQESALPRTFPPFPDIDRFDIYASIKMARDVGGDFYDFFLIGEGKLGFLIADVSGKGIPAALFMMTAKTQIKSYLESGIPVNEAIDAANHQLCLGNDAGMFVTVFACVLDYSTGALEFVNAGHNPPLLHHDGQWEWIREVSGMPLGLFDGLPYDRFERQLSPADTLYLYTDGVTEAMNKDGNLFGEERLEWTLSHYGGMNARSMSVGVRRAITDFTLDAEQSDDITMLTMRYGVPPEKSAVMVLPADTNQLIHVYNFIHEELKRRSAPNSVYGPLDIAAEELFVNVCHYAYPDDKTEQLGEVRVGFEYEANPPSLTVTIADDGIPYDPLAKPDAVTPDDIADVPIGGLGILMAKRSVDEMTYERVGDSNVVTFRKGW